MRKFFRKNIIWIVIFAVIFLFSLTFPFTGDDLAWSLNELSLKSYIDIIKNPGLNGRYLGNLSVLLMTRTKLMRGLIVGVVSTGIIKIIKEETKASKLAIILLLLIMPIDIFAQSVVWASGFANYVISTYLLLLCLIRIRKQYYEESSYKKSFINITLFIASSLFIENVTVFLLGLTFILNVVYYIKNKKINWNLATCFLGSLIGTTLMFIQPAYRNVLTSVDTYRSINFGLGGIIEKVFINYNFWISPYAVYCNTGLIIILNTLLISYYRKNYKKYSNNIKGILNVSFIFSTLYTIYALIYRIVFLICDKTTITLYLISSSVTILYLIILILELCMLFYKKKSFWKIMTPILIIIGLVAPLTIVSPIGPRNFFLIYILEMIEVLYILGETDIKLEKFKYLLLVLIVLILGIYTVIYSYISSVSLERDKYVTYISNETTRSGIMVPALPFHRFVHFPDYGNDVYWKKIYIDYLGVRDNLDFFYIPYEEWKREHNTYN